MTKFLKDMIERAIKTSAQTAIATIGTSSFIGEIDWVVTASTVGLATILSLLTSIASYPVGDENASLVLGEKDE